jgi:hypothetical protein
MVRMGADKKCTHFLWKDLLGSRDSWANNLTIDLREIACDSGKQMNLAQDHVQ